MKQLLAAALAALMMISVPAAAQQPPGPNSRERPDRTERDRERPPGREAVWPTRGGQDGHGRMSPQEREQLRRDINTHGRDIYRQDRGRR
jgi:hypothetical protein